MKVQVCCGRTCKANFSEYIVKRIYADIERLNLKDIDVEETNCMGMCSIGPNVKIDGEILNKCDPTKVSDRILHGPKKKKKKKNKS